MSRRYEYISYAAIGVGVGAFLLAVYLGQGSTTVNIWGPGGAPPFLAMLIGSSILAFQWARAKESRLPGWIGLLPPPLSILALLVVIRSGRSPAPRDKP
ncbi:hypothetical protein D0B54_10595 [Solimonas sp. K1W22B-7]|uniref:hypothetical protein n=1 Tax=Solimonas sp. K1W22B-7 TaxID=2303331 RepID=UPI000E331425|nr:hypothetical protein [Solimonas sp. K1W22B-7]AXQ29108.1 hypothetical protein D0B54_10595 [Solimonas sp. K1W22B-7]